MTLFFYISIRVIWTTHDKINRRISGYINVLVTLNLTTKVYELAFNLSFKFDTHIQGSLDSITVGKQVRFMQVNSSEISTITLVSHT